MLRPSSVRRDAAHMIVLSGLDRDRLARRVDAGRAAGRRDDRKARRELSADRFARVEKHTMALRSPPPDGARDDVARRQFRAGRIEHEPLAAFVDQRRARAAHRLADERHRPRGDVERGRVELHELHVGERGAGPRGQRHALAEAAERIGALFEEAADPAGRNHDPAGRQQRRPSRSDGEDAANRVVVDDEAARLEAFEDLDRGRRPRGRD